MTGRARYGAVALTTFGILAAGALLGSPVLSQMPQMPEARKPPPPPDPVRGRALSERLCAGCHVIARDAAGGAIAGIPSFPAIADRPGTIALTIAGAIVMPHPPMPDVQLTRDEIRDVTAYILSLRQGQ